MAEIAPVLHIGALLTKIFFFLKAGSIPLFSFSYFIFLHHCSCSIAYSYIVKWLKMTYQMDVCFSKHLDFSILDFQRFLDLQLTGTSLLKHFKTCGNAPLCSFCHMYFCIKNSVLRKFYQMGINPVISSSRFLTAP